MCHWFQHVKQQDFKYVM